MLTPVVPRPVGSTIELEGLDRDLFAHDVEEFLRRNPLIVIVTGDRNWADYALVCENLNRFTVGEVHHGGARGADRCAERWAIAWGIPHFQHNADWARYGRAAGPLRNIEMHEMANADLVVAFKNNFGANPHGGTEHMVSLAWDSDTPVWHVDGLGARWLQRP